MIKETKKSPAIRFRGFTDDWEQRKLGEIFTERSEKKHEYLPPLTIIQGCGTVRRDEMDRELIYDKSSLSNYKLVKKNDFIVHLRSFEGGLEKSNIEGIVSPAYHIFHGEKINTEFYYSFFRSNDFINHKLVPFVYGIRDGRSIDIAGMKNIKIPYPSVNEQNRIGTLIGQLNSLVTLHQRKLDQLKKLKKYFLQNTFPAKGEKVPRIRFKGFTGDWEQHKLGECLALITYGFTNPMEDTEDGPWKVTAKDIVDGKINYSSTRHTSIQSFLKLTDKSKPKKDDVLLTKDGTLGRTAIVKNENICINQSVALLRCNDSLIPEYLTILLNSPKCKTKMLNDAGGGTIKHIYITKVDKMFVDVPSLKEQKFVARFFINMDHHITLHQHKLDQLQTMKKFMLQNMFI